MPTVGELFDIRYGHSLELSRLQRVDPPEGVNFVGRAMRNHGVSARVQVPSGVHPGKPGELTVALNGNGVLSTFVQPSAFVTAFHVAILHPRDESMTVGEKLWWSRCLVENRYRFSYGRQANRTLADISLPDIIPGFVEEVPVPDIGQARVAVTSYRDLPQLKQWKAWRLEELFDVRKGRRVTKRDRAPGSTPFVGAAMRNHGITDYIARKPMFPAWSISVPYNGNGVAYAFVQPDPYCASDDVQVLISKDEVCPEALMFVCAVLRAERYRFSYGRKWHLERMRGSEIRLPATRTGKPAWAVMARYMQGLPYSSAVERRPAAGP